MNPASAQATNNQPGAPINRDDSAEVMKIPEPIIEPITIIVPSSRPSPRTSLFDSVFFSAIIAGYYPNQSSEVNGNLSNCAGLFASRIHFCSPGVHAWEGEVIVNLSLLQEAFRSP